MIDQLGWQIYKIASLNRRELSRGWREALLQDPCVYCGRPSEGLDHIKASTKGGSDHWENRAPACARCDNAKGNAPLLVFMVLYHKAGRRSEQAWKTNNVPEAAVISARYGALNQMLRSYRDANGTDATP